MSKLFRKLIALPIAMWSALILDPASAQKVSGDPIKIGVILPLTGAGASLGINQRNGAVLAEKAINGSGGFKGRPIKLIVEDDATNPDTASSKANGLIYGEKVIAIIGPGQAANTLAVGGVTSAIKMPQVALSGLGPAAELERKCVFHVSPPLSLNARAMLDYARSLGIKRAGVLYDSGYGSVVYTELRKYAESYGIELVATEKFEISATDTTTQAAKIRASSPAGIFVIGITGVPIRSIRQLQVKLPIIAAAGQANYEIAKSMGDAADNVAFPEFLVGEDPLPNQKEFVALYQAQYNKLPKISEAMGWDAVHILLAAFDKVGPDAGNEKLCEALRGPYSGVMSAYDFSAADLNGIKLSDFIFSKLVAGQFTRLPFKAKE
ncbi:ABC transporter substrate-binding protein [Bradyrhizobium sp. Ash2021]|uniref:ABC transporter substrate-binding protein n=1 Tax=Bradyrhizobium sp. Ash2021 TaxID=2954771 RepID=UPI00281537DD|nr:ABC transporter substrate-binding protein [Bradyrhizobium sp. Ash2021]WMT76434.1 ABC transporter substrate-binding protein [Bradyrhizobium sp. Ash2021]